MVILEMNNIQALFKNGSIWLRADFHLHTNKASEFNPKEDETKFPELFINKLLEQNIRIAAITNHNQLDLTEFKAIRNLATRNDIYVIPSIEFSVKEGTRGIHILIHFHDDWIYNKENRNYIEDFIIGAFASKTSYNTPDYPNANLDFKQTIENLNKFNKDYFITLAHVDDRNGLYQEIQGRSLEDFLKATAFLKVLAFQKVRNRDNKQQLLSILGNSFSIAEVEGTDNAQEGLQAYGVSNKVADKTQNTYIKLGAYNFDALKFALIDHKNRTSKILPNHISPYIESVTISNRYWTNKVIYLNPEMNNFIGIRGGGKSSLLEAIRYGLDINLADDQEKEYKTRLVPYFLSSGGKISISVKDYDIHYTIERRLNEPVEIKRNGVLLVHTTANSILKTLYFGQKDLAYYGEAEAAPQFFNRLMGDKLKDKRKEITDKHQEIKQILFRLQTIINNLANESQYKQQQANIANQLQTFKDSKVDIKLSRQNQFQKDNNFIIGVIKKQDEIIKEIKELAGKHKEAFTSYKSYTSSENATLVADAKVQIALFTNHFKQLNDIVKGLALNRQNSYQLFQNFKTQFDALKEEFAEIKRKINIPNLEPDTFLKLSNEADLIAKQLSNINLLLSEKTIVETNLITEISILKTLWEQEHQIVQTEIKKVNSIQTKIELKAEFKQAKREFQQFITRMFTGSGITTDKYEAIANTFNDLTPLVTDPTASKEILEGILTTSQLGNFLSMFEQSKFECITFRVPDKYEVYYNGEALDNNSLGQKATALIIFILALKEYNLIMIDQPEDDLDNQTIYTQVIEEIKKLKTQTQFIFATHNPNIPVLGDCEQIVTCKQHNREIQVTVGSIDNEETQENIISILEGGKEAFEIRNKKYNQWKPLLS